MMSSQSSVTESDPEMDYQNWGMTQPENSNLDEMDSRSMSTLATEDSYDAKDVLSAIRTIRSFAQRGSIDFEEDTSDFQVSFDTVLHFTDCLVNNRLQATFEGDLLWMCISSIFDPLFVSDLFDIRHYLLKHAYGDTRESSADEVIVCCVDHFFSGFFGLLVSVLVGGSLEPSKKSGLPLTLQAHKSDSNLRTACQLPAAVDALPTLLISRVYSPALKRLALSILFSIFVVAPDLTECDPWSASALAPEDVMSSLQQYIEEIVVHLETTPVSSQEYEASLAMALTLYASASLEIRQSSIDGILPFQPYTASRLQEVLQLLITDASIAPPESLTEAQAILFHWGRFHLFAWETWNDRNAIGFETATSFTAHWLCHFHNSPLFMHRDQDYEAFPSLIESALRSAVLHNPDAMIITVLHQLILSRKLIEMEVICQARPLLSTSADRNMNMLRLLRALWCANELASAYDACFATATLLEIGREAMSIFVTFSDLSEHESSEARRLVVNFLIRLYGAIVQETFLSLCKDMSYFTKLSTVISKASIAISGEHPETLLLSEGGPSSVSSLLTIISLHCKHQAIQRLPINAFSLLSDVVKFLSEHEGFQELRVSALRCALSVYPCCHSNGGSSSVSSQPLTPNENRAQMRRINKTWEDADVYDIAIRERACSLSLMTELAKYTTLSVSMRTDALVVAEIWDKLRNAFLILTSYQPGLDLDVSLDDGWAESDPQSFNHDHSTARSSAVDHICCAMEAIIERGCPPIVDFVLNSPLTASLIVAVRTLSKASLDGGAAAETNYAGVQQLRANGDDTPSTSQSVEKLSSFLSKLESSMQKTAICR